MSKELLEDIFYHALEGVKAKNVVPNALAHDLEYLYVVDQKIKRSSYKKLYIFGVGKAAFEMAKEAEDILGEMIEGGVVVSLEDQKLNYLQVCKSTHPNVSKKSLECTELLIQEIAKVQEDDLFLFFLSGGSSAMIEKPLKELSFESFQKITDALLISGIDIKAFNTVRKAISSIKGGKLAKEFHSKGFVLVFSDVVGDELQTIGSAPMLDGRFPHYIIASNQLALQNAKHYIKDSFEKVKIVTTTLEKSSKQAAKYIFKQIQKYDQKYDSFCLLFGGETRVKVQGSGRGGRNSELALRIALEGEIPQGLSVLCAGSDGIDGNSDANGAFVDNGVLQKAKKRKLDPKKYLDHSDSASFFQKIDEGFVTGLTHTNVMDFVIVVKQK